MNRRQFLVRSSLIAASTLVWRPRLRADAAAPAAGVTEFHPLRRDTGYFTGRGGTIGWLAAADALVVVDTQFPETAAACLAGLSSRGERMVDVVLNTHHHADHTSGNPILKPASRTIVAHANVPKLQFAAAEKADTLDRQVYADTTFTEVWRRDFGSEIVTAQYLGPAHTSGDIVVQFEKANVVHLGDLMFNRIYPVIDRGAGGTIRGWIARLEEIAKTYPADATYLFGHGNPKFGVAGARDDLATLRDYFTALLEHTEKQIAAGATKEQITALENFPGFEDFHAPLPNRLGANLGAAYDELTEKRG
jgi:glyoxylase-like metal-dependent hydrolase (beta-lactamase superfamily II)